jgi:amino-acid N-acetyltransferase
VIAIELAHQSDFDAIAALLVSAGLPTDGLRECLSRAVVARENGAIVGCAALESYPNGVLLRSVAVAAPIRGRGVGQQLTDAALRLARNEGAPAAFLLTNTAAQFFPRFGFDRITRAEVPDDVRQSIEFVSACCASAVVMKIHLDAGS